MKCVFPAVFVPEPEGGYSVRFPDLPGCVTCGDELADAMEMGRDALAMWICDAEDKSEDIPRASALTSVEFNTSTSFVSLLDIDTEEYRRRNDGRAVKKTLTIPGWLNYQGEKAGVNFSQVLQDALKDRLGLADRRPGDTRASRRSP